MRTVIDVDDDVLEAAQRELGTTTKKDTVNAALKYCAQRAIRAAAITSKGRLLGWGEDIDDPEVMKDARR